MIRHALLCLALAGCDIVLGLDRPPPPKGPWQSVVAGGTQTCGLQVDGTLWCWGTGLEVRDTPTQIGDARWTSISTRHDHICGIQTDATLWCWGDNLGGQLGDGTTIDRAAPVQIAGAWLAVSTGKFSTCAIRDTGVLACWGTQLGSSPTTSTLTPMDLAPELAGWTAIEVASGHACGLREGELWCWGNPFNGRLGDEKLVASIATPTRIGGDLWRLIAAAGSHTCGIRDDGRLACWGDNRLGQLGTGTRVTGFVPELVGEATDWTSVTTAFNHSCAVRAGESLWCWGDNASGKHGVTTSAFDLAPVEILNERGWTAATAGPNHLCAIDGNQQLFCVGARASGQLGDGTTHELAPVALEGTTWASVSMGVNTACAHDAEGTPYCWGEGAGEQIGDGASTSRQEPTRNGPRGGRQIVVGTGHACELRAPGAHSLYCWGSGGTGQLGTGATADEALPVASGITIPYPTYTTIAVGGHTCAIDTNRELWCWGNNSDLQIINLSMTVFPSPMRTGPTPWIAVGAGRLHTCAIAATGGALSCWGYVNQATDTPSTTVFAVPFTGSDRVATGARHTCVWKTDGQGACWGDNALGAVGAGNPISSVPTLLPGTWHQLAVGEAHTCGVAANRTLWCWGDNTHGQLGDGTRTGRMNPTQISAEQSWDVVAAGITSTCAHKTDGTIWCWGDNADGQLGNARAWRADFVEVF